jgi:hypothetical protein
MRPEEPPGPEVPREPPTPPPESPEVQERLRHYRSRALARRQKRRRYLLIAAGALMAGTGLSLAVMGIGRPTPHQKPSPTPEAVQPSAAPSRERGELRAPPPEPPAAQEARPAALKEPLPPVQPRTTPPPAISPTAAAVSYQPRERLTAVRAGDTKERVFELFGNTVERRNGSLVRIEGMRLRASGRSRHHARVEVAEVTIADTGAGSLYWFLFGDGRLIVWGRPEEWPAAAGRYEVEIDYR